MRKKAIIILLIIPFIIAIIAFVEARNKIKEVEQDITSINFNYKENEGFSLSSEKIKLEATAIYDKDYPLAEGNNLIWSSSNPEVCEVRYENGSYYLYFLSVGECVISCQNEKGNVAKSFNCHIFGSNGGVLLNFKRGFSNSSISGEYAVGLYNLDYSNAEEKTYNKLTNEEEIEVTLIDLEEEDLEVRYSNNIEFSLEDNLLKVLDEGYAYIEVYDKYNEAETKTRLEFLVVDGVNVYSYNDLLLATNYSNESLKIVQRVNFESLKNLTNSENTVLFGNYENGSFNFENEVYQFTTTFNHSFIDKWNGLAEPVSTTIVAGIHITNDFYGNGFTINLHNLCYPSDTQEITDGSTTTTIPLLRNTDLFRGPNIYLSVGAPKTKSSLGLQDYTYAIYALYGQDNIGFYVDGDNININDVHIKNCDFGSNFYNLEYTGTVLEVNGDNVSINNSIIENGRNVVRSYSSNLNINNCLLQKGMEFLIKAGSNKGERVELDKRIYLDNNMSFLVKDFLSPSSNVVSKDYKADSILTSAALLNTPGGAFFGFSEMPYTKEEIISYNEVIKEALDSSSKLYDFNGNKKYDNYLTVTDTFFYNSGLSAIMLDTLSNGSYLETNVTSLFSLLLGSYIPLFPSKMAYTSYPTLLTLEGDNRFYDYKDVTKLDYSTLLFQDIEGLILAHGGVGSVEVTDDNYLPLRLLIEKETDYQLVDQNVNYVNLPIMKMGGGVNLSDVVSETELMNFSVDPYSYALDLETEMVPDFNTNPEAKRKTMLIAMTRASSNILGFEPYCFYSIDVSKHLWYQEVPNINDLRD